MGIGQRLVIAACLVEAAAFAPPRRAASPASTVVRRMGMFDFFKPTMGEDQAWKDEQLQAQREILERRRSKDKRQKYMEKVEAGRRKRDAEVNTMLQHRAATSIHEDEVRLTVIGPRAGP